MAGGPSVYVSNATLNKTLKGVDFSSPSALWLALFTTSSEVYLRSNTVASALEVGNSYGYARVSIPIVNITSPVNGQCQISVDTTFNTASGSWGSIYQAALVDSATYNTGNIWYFGTLSASAAVQSGDVIKIPAYGFTINM